MTDWQERLVGEAKSLSEKIVALTTFVAGSNYLRLSENERGLLIQQLRYMIDYQYVLNERISLYKTLSGDSE